MWSDEGSFISVLLRDFVKAVIFRLKRSFILFNIG